MVIWSPHFTIKEFHPLVHSKGKFGEICLQIVSLDSLQKKILTENIETLP